MPDGERGGIGGLRKLIRALKDISAPVLLTPGVIHLHWGPAFRKTNRVDMGTADKVCSVVLAIDEQMRMRGCLATEVSLILLELGGAFKRRDCRRQRTDPRRCRRYRRGRWARAAGALDGEVAFLQGTVTKDMLFHGGASTVAGAESTQWLTADTPAGRTPGEGRLSRRPAQSGGIDGRGGAAPARDCSVGAIRAGTHYPCVTPIVWASAIREHRCACCVDSRRMRVMPHKARRCSPMVCLAGVPRGPVNTLGIRAASGTVLDHLYIISRAAARKRLKLGE